MAHLLNQLTTRLGSALSRWKFKNRIDFIFFSPYFLRLTNSFRNKFSFGKLNVFIILTGIISAVLSFVTISNNQSIKSINAYQQLIEKQITEKVRAYEQTLHFVIQKIIDEEILEDNNVLQYTLKQFQGTKIKITGLEDVLFGSLAVGEITKDQNVSYIAGTSRFQPQWSGSFIAALAKNPKAVSISQPFHLLNDKDEKLINIAIPFFYKNKLYFINMVLCLSELFENVERLIQPSNLSAVIKSEDRQEHLNFNSSNLSQSFFTKEYSIQLSKAPYILCLYQNGINVLELQRNLLIILIFLLTCFCLYQLFIREKRFLSTGLKEEEAFNLKQQHEAFKEAAKEAEKAKNQVLKTYFEILTIIIKEIKADIVNFGNQKLSPAASYRKCQAIWDLAEEIECGSIPFSSSVSNFNLLDILIGALAFHKVFLHQNNVQLVIEKPSDFLEIKGNEFLLKILFIRILDYCLQDVPQEGSLQIEIKQIIPNNITLSFFSNGFGLNDQDLSFLTFNRQEEDLNPLLCHFYSIEYLSESLGTKITTSATLYQGRNIELSLPTQLELIKPIQSEYPFNARGEVVSLFHKSK